MDRGVEEEFDNRRKVVTMTTHLKPALPSHLVTNPAVVGRWDRKTGF